MSHPRSPSLFLTIELEKEASQLINDKEEETKKSDPDDGDTWKHEEKEEENHNSTDDKNVVTSQKIHPKGNKVHTLEENKHGGTHSEFQGKFP